MATTEKAKAVGKNWTQGQRVLAGVGVVGASFGAFLLTRPHAPTRAPVRPTAPPAPGPLPRAPVVNAPPATNRQTRDTSGNVPEHPATTTAGRNQVQTAQMHLHDMGFNPGAIDGVMGANTVRAILAFLRSSRTVQTPEVRAAIAAYASHPRGNVSTAIQASTFGLIDVAHGQASGAYTATPPNYVPPATNAPAPAPMPAALPPGQRPRSESEIRRVSGSHRQSQPIPTDLGPAQLTTLVDQLNEMGFDAGSAGDAAAGNNAALTAAVAAFRAALGISPIDPHDLAVAVDAEYGRHA